MLFDWGYFWKPIFIFAVLGVFLRENYIFLRSFRVAREKYMGPIDRRLPDSIGIPTPPPKSDQSPEASAYRDEYYIAIRRMSVRSVITWVFIVGLSQV